jgi:hypothetical protein
VNTSKTPACSNRIVNAVGSTLGSVPVTFMRFIVLSALGAAMVWLFSPSKYKPTVPLGIDHVQAASAPVPFTTAQAIEAVHEPDSVASQPGSGTAASMPDQSPAPSPAEQFDRSQKESAKLARTSHHRFPAAGGARNLSGNRGRATFLHSRHRTSLHQEIEDVKIRLISLWRRSALSGGRHHKVSAFAE